MYLNHTVTVFTVFGCSRAW